MFHLVNKVPYYFYVKQSPHLFNTGWHKKTRTFEKTQQKLKKFKKKILLTEIEPLQLPF